MRLVRFMSASEAIQLLQGRRMQNRTIHSEYGQSSNSVGFCFALGDASVQVGTEIYEAARLLSGITIMHVCLVAHIPEPRPAKWVDSYGRYSGGVRQEICTVRYNLEDFTSWAFFAPIGLVGTMPAYSGNWTKPKLIAKKEVA